MASKRGDLIKGVLAKESAGGQISNVAAELLFKIAGETENKSNLPYYTKATRDDLEQLLCRYASSADEFGRFRDRLGKISAATGPIAYQSFDEGIAQISPCDSICRALYDSRSKRIVRYAPPEANIYYDLISNHPKTRAVIADRERQSVIQPAYTPAETVQLLSVDALQGLPTIRHFENSFWSGDYNRTGYFLKFWVLEIGGSTDFPGVVTVRGVEINKANQKRYSPGAEPPVRCGGEPVAAADVVK